eukprot:732005-Rhodomonas_salina.2
MMKGMYLRPTWVDFLNHFNIPEFRLRVDRDLGAVFAQKKCRALYLERDVPFHVQVSPSSCFPSFSDITGADVAGVLPGCSVCPDKALAGAGRRTAGEPIFLCTRCGKCGADRAYAIRPISMGAWRLCGSTLWQQWERCSRPNACADVLTQTENPQTLYSLD